jgi:actin-related protein
MKFVGKNNYYGKPKVVDETLPTTTPNNLPVKVNNNDEKKKNIIDTFFHEDDALKLANFSVGEFSNELEKSISANKRMFLWSKRRENEKIRLDNEYQVLLLEKIRNLREHNREVNLLKADAIFSEEFILALIAEKRMEAQHIFELAVANHNLVLTKTKTEIDLNVSLVEHDNIEKERKRKENAAIDADTKIKLAQADKASAEAEKIKADARSIDTINDLRVLVMSKIDFNNFPPRHLSRLLAALSRINPDFLTHADLQDRLDDIFVDMETAKAKKAHAEVDDFINSAEYRKWKNDQAKRDAGL